ncbi:hypothetical protein F0562_030870 [Nyssa sinensis]|uniref:Uncharacterized protein n=1 Tax=Nyssa sinensis TaxID=561372 RepID=A0A5J5AZT5_9ASTE|nr:hypothetical protein F0562_030870 [Nyssa sinensis]
MNSDSLNHEVIRTKATDESDDLQVDSVSGSEEAGKDGRGLGDVCIRWSWVVVVVVVGVGSGGYGGAAGVRMMEMTARSGGAVVTDLRSAVAEERKSAVGVGVMDERWLWR